MKRSAGILLWKKEGKQYYVLLTHFGGPYWDKKDKGAWSIQKGITESGENVLMAAKREVSEETNLILDKPINYLASKKVSNNKLVIMFESYFDGDISNFKSNTFELEWPIKSGKYKTFPEMDKIKWFTLEEALLYINPSQVFFIRRLKDRITLMDNNGELVKQGI